MHYYACFNGKHVVAFNVGLLMGNNRVQDFRVMMAGFFFIVNPKLRYFCKKL
jgi:hypothetical protein